MSDSESKMPESTKAHSERRTELLTQIDLWRETHPTRVPEITDDMTDDQVEIVLLRLNEKLKPPKMDYIETLIKTLPGLLPGLISSLLSTPVPSSSKPDFIIHHVVKIEH